MTCVVVCPTATPKEFRATRSVAGRIFSAAQQMLVMLCERNEGSAGISASEA